MKKFIAALLLISFCFGIIFGFMPSDFTFFENDSVTSGNSFVTLDIGSTQTMSGTTALPKGKYTAKLKLFGLLPIKTARITVLEKIKVAPLGVAFGLKLYTDGVIVVDISDFICNGEVYNPAYSAGIRVGDIITSYNGVKIKSNEQLIKEVNKYNGTPQEVQVQRNNLQFTASVTPVADDSDGIYRIGLWVRDSTAGIGMLSFYNKNDNILVGLGHSVSDTDTGLVMPVSTGELVLADIKGAVKGEKGAPGELAGNFIEDQTIGILTGNETSGLSAICVTEQFENYPEYEIALKKDIKTGKAQILSCVEGRQTKSYDVEIIKINNNLSETKNMVIKITDKELLKKTGGIVRGMSGSPILQNGKLIGAVTHVLVDDPTKGYAIFIENMLSAK